MAVVVVTDSSARIPEETRLQWGIRQVPLHILLDGTDLRDGVDDIPDNIHEYGDATTAAVSRNHGFIVVHQLDNLRRSGRIGGAGAWLGTKLSLKPLLRIDDGKLVLAQRVRTANKAVATMIDRVSEIVGERSASLAVHHVANPDGAQNLVAALAERLPGAEPALVTDLGPVLALHVGAGALGVCVELND